jgi:hypothetical protein
MEDLKKTNGEQTANKRPDGTFALGHKLGNRFAKGVSGNEKGRPKLTRLSEAIRAQLAEAMPGASESTIAEEVARALIREALSGNVQAIKECFDRSEGRAPLTLDVGNKDGEPMLITFSFNNSNTRLISDGDDK